MANISTPSILGKQNHNFNDEHKDNTLFTLPFSEHDVLELQGLFVALGVHTIKTKNIIDGRRIIQTILQSLNYYHNIGSISDVSGLPINVCDVINHIKLQRSQKGDLLIDLEAFFAVHPCFDFIWIEFTESMKNQYSAKDIKNIFEMYHAQERMSVLIVTYDEE
jgi:hypothetical protein